MRIVLGIMLIVLVIIGIVSYFQLRRFLKIHAQEEFEVHKKYIISKVVIICVVGTLCSCIGLIGMLSRY